MFTSGYLKLIKLQLIYLISSLQHGFPFSQIPMITSDTGVFDTVITCSITGQETVPVSFYEEDRLVVQIKTSSGYCQQDPPNLPNNARCSCLGQNASCTVSTGAYGENCPRWKCAVPIKGVLQYSKFVNVCTLKHTSLTTKIIDADNCSNNLFNGVIWSINGLNIQYNMILSILKTYNTANLSSFVHKYQTHTRASITACRLETQDNEAKTLDIFDPSELCEINSIMPVNKTCNITDVNPTVSIIRDPTIASKCPSIPRTQMSEVLMLCDAVNRIDVGAENFVGNKVGHFKLEILIKASVGEFFIEGFSNQIHITFHDTNQVTIWCRGDGHPAPEMQLLKKGFQYSRGKSPIRYTMTPSGSHDTGMYTCVAANALGKDSKEIEINFHIDTELHQGETENTHKKDDKQSTVVIVGVCSTVAGIFVLLTLSVCLLKRGYSCVSLVRFLRSSAIVESHNDINENSAHADMNTGTNYAFFEGRFPDDETHSSEVVNVHASSIEIAEMSHAFDNETYAESIKILEEGTVNKTDWSGPDQAPAFCRLKCSKDDPKYSWDMGAIEAIKDDPMYTGVIAAAFALSATTCTSKPEPSEDAKCSVVSRKKQLYDVSNNGTSSKAEPNDCIGNVFNTPSMPDGGIYSDGKKKKTTDGEIFGVCYNNEKPDDDNGTGVLNNPLDLMTSLIAW